MQYVSSEGHTYVYMYRDQPWVWRNLLVCLLYPCSRQISPQGKSLHLLVIRKHGTRMHEACGFTARCIHIPRGTCMSLLRSLVHIDIVNIMKGSSLVTVISRPVRTLIHVPSAHPSSCMALLTSENASDCEALLICVYRS